MSFQVVQGLTWELFGSLLYNIYERKFSPSLMLGTQNCLQGVSITLICVLQLICLETKQWEMQADIILFYCYLCNS